ncbi:MAG TPA: hypothetical protein VFD84_16345 [Candidatus Binatia bacterium]|nr:hypothetical protein [Candidatus Binatia bacterium]
MSARVVLALAVVAAVGAACGRKSVPIAPELVRPETAEGLAAVATPEGVRLSWLRPLRYTGGRKMNDLDGFEIERAAADGERPTWDRIGEITLDDRTRFRKARRIEWTDTEASPGRRYLYRVRSRTLDGYRSAWAGPVAIRFGAAAPSEEAPPVEKPPAAEPAPGAPG